MNDNPLVSICCTTYNQENYISQAIEGFLMQQTSFSFEILIHDDASTDRTTEIIRKYKKKHPDIIKPIFQEENQYSKGIRIHATFQFSLARGKYIAICEGDDFWTDPLKLRKQVDLMEKYPYSSLCVALVKKINSTTGEETIDNKYVGENLPLIYFNDLTKYFHTSTYLIRKSTLDYLLVKYQSLFMGDTAIRYLLINEGPFVVLNDLVSVYRSSNSGIWTSLCNHSRNILHYDIYNKLRKYHVPERRKFYARNELKFLHLIIIFKIRIGDYNNLRNMSKQFIWLLYKYDLFFYFKLFYSNIKAVLYSLLKKKIYNLR